MASSNKLNISVASLEKALKDLEEHEEKYQLSTENLKQQQIEIENLKCEKQHLLLCVEANKQKVCEYQDKLMAIKTKIDDALLKTNKAELADLYNKQKIKQLEEFLKTTTIPFETEISSTINYRNDKEDLITQKTKLEEIISTNNTKMKNLKAYNCRNDVL